MDYTEQMTAHLLCALFSVTLEMTDILSPSNPMRNFIY